MDCLEVLKARRSSRHFRETPIQDEDLQKILECANLAPSPLNMQPWEFIAIKSRHIKQQIFDAVEQFKKIKIETGSRWLSRYRIDFLLQAPVLIAIVGDPQRAGLDSSRDGQGDGYKYACGAAIENMLLAAHSLGLGSLWFTLFDREEVERILDLPQQKQLIALVCIGYAGDHTPRPAKIGLAKKVTVL